MLSYLGLVFRMERRKRTLANLSLLPSVREAFIVLDDGSCGFIAPLVHVTRKRCAALARNAQGPKQPRQRSCLSPACLNNHPTLQSADPWMTTKFRVFSAPFLWASPRGRAAAAYLQASMSPHFPDSAARSTRSSLIAPAGGATFPARICCGVTDRP